MAGMKAIQSSTVDIVAWRDSRAPERARSAELDVAIFAALESPSKRPEELAQTCALLDELGADANTLAAAIRYAVAPQAPAPPALAGLIEGQRDAEKVWNLHRNHHGSAEGLRRLLLSIVRDVRVVFILLARQLARLRTAAQADEGERRALAELSADIHAPLANRLGIWQVKWEMEDLAFRYLQPDTYKRVARLLDERRGDRLDDLESPVESILDRSPHG